MAMPPPRGPSAPLPRFEHTDHAGIAAFFGRTGYVCVAGALSAAEVAALNALCDDSQARWPRRWSQREMYPPPELQAADLSQVTPPRVRRPWA